MKRKTKQFLRILGLLVVLLFIVIVVAYNQQLKYVIVQAHGQIKLVRNAVPIVKMLQDSSLDDRLRRQFEKIEQIKHFANTELGLNTSKNYTTFYDQKGKEILWLLLAAPPYKLESYQWKFPFAGHFPYLGFFDSVPALHEEKRLKAEGYDTRIGHPAGWSTLGIFKDPILSGMLKHTEGRLANLLIHEMTHATIFDKKDAVFNENIATFIGHKGALHYLSATYGDSSEIYRTYIKKYQSSQLYTQLMQKYAQKFDSLYSGFAANMPDSLKQLEKHQLMQQMKQELKAQIPSGKYDNLNNTHFTQYLLYNRKQSDFEEIYIERFNSDIVQFIDYYKNNPKTK